MVESNTVQSLQIGSLELQSDNHDLYYARSGLTFTKNQHPPPSSTSGTSMMFGEYSESSGSKTKFTVVVRMTDTAHGKKI